MTLVKGIYYFRFHIRFFIYDKTMYGLIEIILNNNNKENKNTLQY